MPKKKAAKNSGTQSLLVEFLTEELPPKSLQRLAERFRDALASGLEGVSLLPRPYVVKPHCFATPRRLAVLIQGVLEKANNVSTDKAGPLVSAGAEAAKGFARKHGVAVESLKKIPTSDGDKWFASYTSAGAVLDDVLAQKVEEALKVLPVPKLMRWGNSEAQFARPVHGLVMLHGRRIIPGNIWGLESRNYTLGHRFLSSGKIAIPGADQYEAVLEKKGLAVVSFAKRKELIRVELEKKAAGAKIIWDDALLSEVTALVEYPVVYTGTFNPEYLALPQECLILSMQRHQRYFPLADAKGKLLPRFLLVSNIRSANPANIIRGNERVLSARLADAKFFYDQDRKMRLEARVPRLANVVYHNKLGSQLERVERIQLLAGKIAREIGADPLLAERAAWLAKADLLTEMVGEFPELQGIMGRYYALHDGEPKEVADAIEQHYHPRFAKDRLPASPVARAVALADKFESLNSMFSVGGAPTGEKDPYGLRRAALGVLNILIEAKLPLELSDHAKGEVYEFMLERLRHLLRDRGYAPDEIEAVVSQSPSRIDLVLAKLDAVKTFRKMPEAESLAEANKRIRNILRKSVATDGQLSEALLQEKEERDLFKFMQDIDPKITLFVQKGDFTASLTATATVQPSVTAFFDKVLVNADDAKLRANRHALLKRLESLMSQVADISKLTI
jgi:glycyl-tRNA synthetase beta chain